MIYNGLVNPFYNVVRSFSVGMLTAIHFLTDSKGLCKVLKRLGVITLTFVDLSNIVVGCGNIGMLTAKHFLLDGQGLGKVLKRLGVITLTIVDTTNIVV